MEGQTKCCSRCREIKPVAEFYHQKSSPGGYGYYCKRCVAARGGKGGTAAHDKHREYIVMKKQGMRRCSNCGQVKPVTEFHKDGFYKNGQQNYKYQCRVCTSGGRRVGWALHLTEQKLKPNLYRIEGDTAHIELRNKDGRVVGETLVSVSDLESVIGRRLCATYRVHTTYVLRIFRKSDGQKKNHELLHRFIMQPPENMQVDHINGNGLDNRRENLRIVTQRENNLNMRRKDGTRGRTDACGPLGKSGVRGVTWRAKYSKWAITINGQQFGLFVDLDDAIARMVEVRSALKNGTRVSKLSLSTQRKKA